MAVARITGRRDRIFDRRRGLSGVENAMKDFQLRVVEERQSLDEKRAKLAVFINGDLFKSLTLDEQDRLIRQIDVMDAYSQILNERISEF